MQHLKEQLEQRTRMIEASIQKQQEELRQIHEQLQKVHGQGTQVHTCNCVNIGIDNFTVIKKQKHVIEMVSFR